MAPAAKLLTDPVQLQAKLSRLDPRLYTESRCRELSGLIEEIVDLKARRHAVILVHNYQRPEIFEVADDIGDSLALSQAAARTDAEAIVFAGVQFMAETAAVLNPEKTVLLPNLAAGCSLASSAPADEVGTRIAELRRQHPDLAVVAYVNTSVEVKALADVCCTSANAVRIVTALPNRHVLFIPDRNLAAYVQGRTDKVIIPWDGDCYVHEQITAEEISRAHESVPEAVILVHPECREDVIAIAEATGGAVLSTDGMARFAKSHPAREFLVVTECGLSDRLFLEVPEKKFYKACKLCHFMKANSLEDVRDSLRLWRYEVRVPEPVAARARRALERMLELSNVEVHT